MSELKHISVAIREYDDCWVIEFPEGEVQYLTACDALGGVEAYGRSLAGEGYSSAIVVTWNTKTVTGLLVVKAIADYPREERPR